MEIFLLRLDRIGDFILGIPAYRALRKAHPQARISVVVPSDVGELAKDCPYFDEVFLFEALWLKPGAGPWERWGSALRLIQFLRARTIDLLIDFRYQSRMDPIVAGFSGAAQRMGYDLGPGRYFLSRKVPRPSTDTHQIERNLAVTDSLGIPRDGTHLEMWTEQWDKKKAEAHMPLQQLLPGVPRVGVHLGASTPSKRWGEESFSALIHEIHLATQAQILVFGAEPDIPFAHEVLDGLECPVVNLVGKLTLRQMAVLVRECSAFVGLDSGSTHLAAACGVPVVSLFSAANRVAVWKPWGEKIKTLTEHPSCSPCESFECRRRDGYFCMNEIKVEDVVSAVKELTAPQPA